MSDIEMKKIAEELDRETDSAYTSRKLRKEIDKVSKKNKPKTTESELVTPEILNLDYRYVKLLGEGANGLTWLAKDRRTALNVAIKELKFVNDLKSFELFQREAEVLQSIRVDGVPRCYKNITKDLTSYIIQDYIPYPSLEKYLEDGVIFSEDEVFTILELVSQILFALQTQYIPAIIHRDIKPGNILYRAADRNNDAKVWLIDFGAVDNAHKQSSGSTIAGTFGYMAPEQLQGEVSPRSDFYSLGATALHLLTGVFPYEIPNELFHLQFHPVIEEKAPKTSKPMIELLDYLLASNAEERPQDVHALRNAIFDAMESSKKYQKITAHADLEYPDWYPNTRLGIWIRSTKFGTKWHARRLATKRRRFKRKQERIIARELRRLELEEKRQKELQKKKEQEAKAALEKFGVECTCTVRRVSSARVGHRDVSMLEGLFTYDGFWYTAFVLNTDERVGIKCTKGVDTKKKQIEENTFKVRFAPEMVLTEIINQEIWLSPDFYTKFTGRMA